MSGEWERNVGETLLEAIRQVVREEIRAALGNGQGTKGTEASAKPYLTVKEAADMACLAPSTIRLAIRKRQLLAHRVGRRVVIRRTDLETFLESRPIVAVTD